MKKVTMKRHGFGDLVRLHTDFVYVEFFHLSGMIHISVQRRHLEGVFHGRTLYQGEQPLLAIPEIAALVRMYTGEELVIEPDYVEAYMIARTEPLYPYTANDKPCFKGICVAGLTVREVDQRVGLHLLEDFPYYHVDELFDRFVKGDEALLRMDFVELITELHNNHSKHLQGVSLR